MFCFRLSNPDRHIEATHTVLITFPLKLIQNKFIAEGGGEGPCHKHVRKYIFKSLKTLLRHGVGQVELLDRTPLAPDVGDCPTFAVPHSNVSAYKVVL